jgi:hypothetical protein
MDCIGRDHALPHRFLMFIEWLDKEQLHPCHSWILDRGDHGASYPTELH